MVSDASAEAGLSLRTIPRSASAGIALAMVAGFVIRACTGDCPMLRDELSSIVFASQPLSRLWSVWMVRQTNPPLFHSLLRGWLALRARLVTQIRCCATSAVWWRSAWCARSVLGFFPV
jgi:hypothetical protein